MSTFENVTNKAFKQQAKEYFDMTLNRTAVTHDQAINGNKALQLLYIGSTNDWSDKEIHEAIITLELATKREMEVGIANACKIN